MSTQTEITGHRAAMGRVRDHLLTLDSKTLVPTLFKFLTSANKSKAEVAEIVLMRMGSQFLPLLITQAVVNQQRPEICLRILGLMEKIETPPQAMDGMLLIPLVMNVDAAVRHKAQQILEVWRAAWDRPAGPCAVGPVAGRALFMPGAATW